LKWKVIEFTAMKNPPSTSLSGFLHFRLFSP
jgi:hypothetical protein